MFTVFSIYSYRLNLLSIKYPPAKYQLFTTVFSDWAKNGFLLSNWCKYSCKLFSMEEDIDGELVVDTHTACQKLANSEIEFNYDEWGYLIFSLTEVMLIAEQQILVWQYISLMYSEYSQRSSSVLLCNLVFRTCNWRISRKDSLKDNANGPPRILSARVLVWYCAIYEL